MRRCVGLHDSERVTFGILAVRQIADAGYSHLGGHDFPAGRFDFSKGFVDRHDIHGIHRACARMTAPEQTSIDAWTLFSSAHEPIISRPGPFLEFQPKMSL